MARAFSRSHIYPRSQPPPGNDFSAPPPPPPQIHIKSVRLVYYFSFPSIARNINFTIPLTLSSSFLALLAGSIPIL